jgi:hypothetical protein
VTVEVGVGVQVEVVVNVSVGTPVNVPVEEGVDVGALGSTVAVYVAVGRGVTAKAENFITKQSPECTSDVWNAPAVIGKFVENVFPPT